MSELVEIARSWLRAMNKYDLDGMSSLCWEDAVGDEIAEPSPAEGREQIATSYRELFAAYPDCTAEVLNMFSGQNQVLAEVRWTGTNKGDFRGTPATGKSVDLRIAYIFKIDNKRIRRITEYYDGATLGRQLGLSP
jgi:steroid delta-isomerase-like uncharacterized protein